MYFVFLYTPGASWLAGKSILEQPLEEHFAYMAELEAANILQLGGGFTDDAGAMGILEVETLEIAEDIAFNDPAVKNGIMNVSVHPWIPSVKGCIQ